MVQVGLNYSFLKNKQASLGLYINWSMLNSSKSLDDFADEKDFSVYICKCTVIMILCFA